MVLPAVLNAPKGLSITIEQASWFGSIAFLCQPLGSLFSGPLLDYFGRKKALFIVNIPHVIAWLLIYYAWSVPVLFIGNALLGIGTGIMEAPSITYVGEVSDPSLRGILTTLTNSFTSTGIFMAYLLGSVLPWRQAALAALSIPLITMVLVLFVPETPVWLLSKGRQKQALRSLCRLRGWAKPEEVKEEFDQLVLTGAVFIAMNLLSAIIVKLIGKRKLILGALFATSCCSLGISVYAGVKLPSSVFSYEIHTFPEEKSFLPVLLFILLVCFSSLGIPWVLLSEVFPFRSRGVATSLAAAFSYIIFFLSSKTNYNIEANLHLSGTFALYSAFGLIGTVYLYFFLPETESKTLLEIEAFYKGNRKIFADDFLINAFRKKRNDSNERASLY
ncbi:unnamed protein product [Diatraea saccharalis]|uniref:Major facilitator superfamily (MFS) profile domain-containing protein n=1 Tax=Diatraea saccharalis TaxID=40085 RepID=A0A9N9WIW8_9NEOP|nr:unnamed protein product [Diatraea saccharalis]